MSVSFHFILAFAYNKVNLEWMGGPAGGEGSFRAAASAYLCSRYNSMERWDLAHLCRDLEDQRILIWHYFARSHVHILQIMIRKQWSTTECAPAGVLFCAVCS